MSIRRPISCISRAHPACRPADQRGRIAATLEECERVNDGAPITFFEITTAAALLAFSRHPADALVLEVGLGGKYDATNVIARPRVTVITPVGLDHQEFLGTSIADIAAEKAGIIKPGVPSSWARRTMCPRDVIARRADALGAPLYAFGQDFFAHQEHGRMVYQDTDGLLDLPLPRLVGRIRSRMPPSRLRRCATRRRRLGQG
jgi:dihydrofolate synthase/folylpolyglutamate synthase